MDDASTSTTNTRTVTSPVASAPNHISTLRLTTHAFCQALLSPPPAPVDLLKTHFSSNPRITEHGPEWARSRLPFLAKTFTGVDDCCEYFNILAETLEMNMSSSTFPGPEGFVVDADSVVEGYDGSGVVSVVGSAEFKAKASGKSWKEQFIYRFSGFDKSGKIGHWEIWADPLSAWMAVGPGEGFKQADYL